MGGNYTLIPNRNTLNGSILKPVHYIHTQNRIPGKFTEMSVKYGQSLGSFYITHFSAFPIRHRFMHSGDVSSLVKTVLRGCAPTIRMLLQCACFKHLFGPGRDSVSWENTRLVSAEDMNNKHYFGLKTNCAYRSVLYPRLCISDNTFSQSTESI